MANEYLKRRPTSTGNRRVFTWSAWIKRDDTTEGFVFGAGTSNSNRFALDFNGTNDEGINFVNTTTSNTIVLATERKLRDLSSWAHFLAVVDTTRLEQENRVRLYINGEETNFKATQTYPSINEQVEFNKLHDHVLGVRGTYALSHFFTGQLSDVFMVDGQALTPDVFGFYKEGKGYISAGSTQATDFRPGQWVPKTPRVIKAQIERNGGFGVNGYYLPMNDSTNFGADFHTTPNSIITLKGEDLPQPRNGAPDTTDAYVSQLRSDPYAANLVLAVPGIIGGQGSGYGDYSANIKGSGSNKTITAGGGVGVAVTASYYGSAIFFDGTDDYLTTNTSTDFQFGSSDFTVEAWVKYKSGNGADTPIVLDDTSTTYAPLIGYLNANLGYPHLYLSSTGSSWDIASGVAFGPVVNVDQWTHLAISRQGTNISLYRDGVGVGIITDVGSKSIYQNSNQVSLGFAQSNKYFDGHIQDLRVYKGVAKYKGGFDVPNPYTPVGIGTWRAVPDTTANNFATLNGTSIPSKYTITEGNLRYTNSTNNWTGWLEGTVGFSTGKYYWETRIDVNSDFYHIGIVGVGITHFNTADSYKYGISYQPDGRFFAQNNSGTAFASGKTQANDGDIVQVAVDMNDKKMWIGVNGNWIDSGDPAAGTTESFNSTVGFDYQHYVPFYDSYGSSGLSINFGQNPTFGGKRAAGTNTDDNGRGLFSYDVPTGFLALCEDNLPTPAIADPGDYFKTVLWTGDGNSGRSITGVGFKPDFVWMKARHDTWVHGIYDSIRGSLDELSSDNTGAASIESDSLFSFNDDGFSYGTRVVGNQDGGRYVAWCWKAGGAAVSNTDGTITSQVSANQDAGFSIVSYTGTGSAGTVGHGLGKQPKFMLVKNRTVASAFLVYHNYIGGTGGYNFNSTGTNWTDSSPWNDTNPTSSVINIGTNYQTNGSGNNLIAYCWAEIEGFSKFGSFIGNGNADGPFVYCGFKPAWILIRQTGASQWNILDSARSSTNPAQLNLLANDTTIETDGSRVIDFLSNGFKIRTTSSDINANGNAIIFAAFAESPFTTANAK